MSASRNYFPCITGAHHSSIYVGFTYESIDGASVFLYQTIRCFTWYQSHPCHSSCRSPFWQCPSAKSRISVFTTSSMQRKPRRQKDGRNNYQKIKSRKQCSLEGTLLTAGPRSANCQQRRKKLVGRAIKNTPNLETNCVFKRTIMIHLFLLSVQLKQRIQKRRRGFFICILQTTEPF